MAEEYKKDGERERRKKKKGEKRRKWEKRKKVYVWIDGRHARGTDAKLRPDAWPARATRPCRQLLAHLPTTLEQFHPEQSVRHLATATEKKKGTFMPVYRYLLNISFQT